MTRGRRFQANIYLRYLIDFRKPLENKGGKCYINHSSKPYSQSNPLKQEPMGSPLVQKAHRGLETVKLRCYVDKHLYTHFHSSRKHPRSALVLCAEELCTRSKNNTRVVTLGRTPIWEMNSLKPYAFLIMRKLDDFKHVIADVLPILKR